MKLQQYTKLLRMKEITETEFENAMKIFIEQMDKNSKEFEKNTLPLPHIPLKLIRKQKSLLDGPSR